MPRPTPPNANPSHHNAGNTPSQTAAGSDRLFFVTMTTLGGVYVLLIVALVAADLSFTSLEAVWEAIQSPAIRYAIWLSLASSTISAILSLWVAVPIGYLMSRRRFFGKTVVDAILDIPILLPPLVIGLSLLILFRTAPGRAIEQGVVGVATALGFEHMRGIAYEVPAVILAQFTVAAAFAVRTMRLAFEQMDKRPEDVALTLGANRGRAFFDVALPQAKPAVVAAFTLAWARSLGEFGPVLVFAGATRMRTEVLPTTIFLELSVGNLEAAVAVSMVMIGLAMMALIASRILGRGLGVRSAGWPSQAAGGRP